MNFSTDRSRRTLCVDYILCFVLYSGAMLASGCALYDGLSGNEKPVGESDAGTTNPDALDSSDAVDVGDPVDAGDATDAARDASRDASDAADDAPDAPDGSNWEMVTAGGAHTCALRSNKTVWCWGKDDKGQLGIGENNITHNTTPLQVADLTDVTKISAGLAHTCAIVADGSIYCWGWNLGFQLGVTSTDESIPIPTPVLGVPAKAISVAAGAAHTCAIFAGGEVWCWGVNEYGQLGVETNFGVVSRNAPVKVEGILLPQGTISAGAHHTCARNAEALFCWGLNHRGQLAVGSATQNENLPEPTPVDAPSKTTAIATGGDHTCAIDTPGDLYCWGSNKHSQVSGDTPGEDHYRPVLIDEIDATVASITTGIAHSCAIAQGEVYCWGLNLYGQLGRPTYFLNTDGFPTPTPIDGFGAKAIQITAGGAHTCALDAADDIYCWGRNKHGQLGVEPVNENPNPEPMKITWPPSL
jgi:alpha-tubulin suppressor-like RCC1 family protein